MIRLAFRALVVSVLVFITATFSRAGPVGCHSRSFAVALPPSEGLPDSKSSIGPIVGGKDSTVWAAVQGTHYILRVPRFRAVHAVRLPNGGPYGIASASASRVFFTKGALTGLEHYSQRHIGSMDAAGHYRAYTLPAAVVRADDITAASDGSVWFIDYSGGHGGHLNSSGSFRITTLPKGVQQPTSIAPLPDGTVYFGAEIQNNAALFELTGARIREAYRLPYASSIGIISTNGKRVCFTTATISQQYLLGCFLSHELHRTLSVQRIPDVRQLAVDPAGDAWLLPTRLHNFRNELLKVSAGGTKAIDTPWIVVSMLISNSGVLWLSISPNMIAQLSCGH